jgi:hypothetical protein
MEKQKTNEQLRMELAKEVSMAMELGDMRKLGKIYRRAYEMDLTSYYYEAVAMYQAQKTEERMG